VEYRPRTRYSLIVNGRLLEHALLVFSKGCWSPSDCPDCAKLRQAAVLAEPHNPAHGLPKSRKKAAQKA